MIKSVHSGLGKSQGIYWSPGDHRWCSVVDVTKAHSVALVSSKVMSGYFDHYSKHITYSKRKHFLEKKHFFNRKEAICLYLQQEIYLILSNLLSIEIFYSLCLLSSEKVTEV